MEFVIGFVVIAILVFVAVTLYRSRSKTRPPVGKQIPFEDHARQERFAFLETIRTVFSGASTVKQREHFVEQNRQRIVAYLEFSDFRNEYEQLAESYGVTKP